MAAIAGSIYLASTILFGLLAGVIGMRLVLLSRRTGGRPELLLGLGVQLTACWGYMVMMLAIVARSAMGGHDHPLLTAASIFGWVAHDVGVVCVLLFIRRVFRPDAAWAGPVTWIFAAMLAVGFTGNLVTGVLFTGVQNLWYWIGFVPIGSYPLWMSAESIAYGRQMKRRLALGLADPMVADRFRIWAFASACTAGAIWIVNVPAWLGASLADGSAITASAMVVTAGFGIATVCLYWLTFFPPAWYRRRVEARAASA